MGFRTNRILSVLNAAAVVGVAASIIAIVWVSVPQTRTGGSSGIRIPARPVDLDGAPLRGNQSAAVVIVEFSDFQCPFCGRFAREVLPELQRHYVDTGLVRLAFRHLPLPVHANAAAAAVAAVCAARAGKFWEFHDLLFASPGQPLEAEALRGYLESVGVSSDSYEHCIASDAASVIRRDSSEAQDLGITGTPSFVIGKKLSGGRLHATATVAGARPVEVFAEAIDEALAE